MHNENKRLSLIVRAITHPKTIFLSLFGFVVIAVLVNVVFKSDFSYLTQTFGYTAAEANQLLQKIGSVGRERHLWVLVPDVLMVLLYEILLIGANYAITTKLTGNCLAISILTFAPLLLALLQLTEIIALAIVLINYPAELSSLLRVTSIVTMLKTVLTVIFFLLPVVGLLTLGVKKLARRV